MEKMILLPTVKGSIPVTEETLIRGLKQFGYHLLHNAFLEDFDEGQRVKQYGKQEGEIRADKVLVKADITIAEES